MNKTTKNYIFASLITLLALSLISILVYFFANTTLLEGFRIVFGSVYVLLIPGFVISFIFFSKTSIDWIERIALSFALSIAIVPLVVFYLNLIGIKINLLNSFLTILGIIAVSFGILLWKKRDIKL
jgi:uncharacterized membrane protein